MRQITSGESSTDPQSFKFKESQPVDGNGDDDDDGRDDNDEDDRDDHDDHDDDDDGDDDHHDDHHDDGHDDRDDHDDDDWEPARARDSLLPPLGKAETLESGNRSRRDVVLTLHHRKHL